MSCKLCPESRKRRRRKNSIEAQTQAIASVTFIRPHAGKLELPSLRHSYSLPNRSSMPKLYTPRDAAQVLGISYASLKQWIYRGKLKSVQTPGGHHRIPESEIDRLLPRVTVAGTPAKRRRIFRRISGRNQLIGRVTDIKISGLLAQVTLSIGDQHITSIITADAVRELRLKKGQIAAALIKSTEVMIILPD